MIFALAFTISCSGEDGKSGVKGKDCTVEENGDIWDVYCGGDLVGILQNNDSGEQGAPGGQGVDGPNGANGSYCKLGSNKNGTFDILCGSNNEVKGSLDGCAAKNVSQYESQITCGKITINLCDSVAFDPAKKYCTDVGTLGDPKDNKGKCQNGKEYIKSTQYCGIASLADKQESPLPLCGVDIGYKIQLNKSRDFSGSGIAATKSACETVTPTNPYPGVWHAKASPSVPDTCVVSDWKKEYCGYSISVVAGPPRKITVTAGISTTYCEDGKPINKDAWSKEYCGYKDKSTFATSAIKGLCDDYDPADVINNKNLGPNELAFGHGYCEVIFSNRKTGITVYSDTTCGTAASNKINNGKWNNEYCGFSNVTPAPTSPDKIYKGLCEDGDKGPHSEGYNKGYCKVDAKDGPANYSTEFCGATSTAAGKKYNENTWKGEYCGFKNKNATEADKVYSGICDDGKGPNQDSYNSGYCQADTAGVTKLSDETCDDKERINEDTWKGEYCGYEQDATETTKQAGACGDDKGPNSDVFGGGYCRADRKGIVEYSTEFCGESGKVNENTWKGEYCGFESATGVANKVTAGICDDDQGPNESAFGAGYCQWPAGGSETKLTNELCGGEKFNEGSWKGEYCFADNQVAKCTGGRKANTEKNSTDAFSVRCEFQNDNLCSSSKLDACDKDGCEDLGAGFEWSESAFECRELASN